MRRSYVLGVVWFLGCVAAPPPAANVTLALSPRGEIELGPIDGFHPQESPEELRVVCNARDTCLVAWRAWFDGGREVVAMRVRHDGTPIDRVPLVVAPRSHELTLTSMASDGMHFVLGIQRTDGTGDSPIVARVREDGTVDPTFAAVGASHLYFDGSQFVSLGVARIDATTGVVTPSPDARSWADLACGPMRCIANVLFAGGDFYVFDRSSGLARATRLAFRSVRPGRLAASRTGFVFAEYAYRPGARTTFFDLRGDVVGDDDTRARYASGDARLLALAYGSSEMYEVDPLAPGAPSVPVPMTIAPTDPTAVAWMRGRWLVATPDFLLVPPHGELHDVSWTRLAGGTLATEARFTGPHNVRAPQASNLRSFATPGGYVVWWREWNQDGLSVRMTTLAADGALGAFRTWPATGAQVVAATYADGAIACLLDGPDGAGRFLQRLALDLRSAGAPEPLSVGAAPAFAPSIAWDGTAFVVHAIERALTRCLRSSPGACAPIPAPVLGASETLGAIHAIAAIDDGVIIEVAVHRSGAIVSEARLMRWTESAGWLDGAGLRVDQAHHNARSAPLVVSEQTLARASIDPVTATARVTTYDLRGPTITPIGSIDLGDRGPLSVARRGAGWLVHRVESDRAIVAFEFDDALVAGAPFVVQTLSRNDQTPEVALACGGPRSCLASYVHYVTEAPYRNWRARARMLTELELGEACAIDAECASGHCVDRVCCDNACGGGASDDCHVCRADGHCSDVTDGETCTGECGAGTCGGGACGAPSCDAGVDAGDGSVVGSDASFIDASVDLDAGASFIDASIDLDASLEADSGGDAATVRPSGCGCYVPGVASRVSPAWMWFVVALAGARVARRTTRS